MTTEIHSRTPIWIAVQFACWGAFMWLYVVRHSNWGFVALLPLGIASIISMLRMNPSQRMRSIKEIVTQTAVIAASAALVGIAVFVIRGLL